ncbi:uncharacterized protein B0I36DRAFT_315812 [Microdochium trichocladiopsis]|uniref:Uncharacterized protein n=1 Tax=Microdochium trichocladiopsis TaxID=1682393 RepID=A0A9P8YHG3_9PEZI|nr:uncharacterized protein B0I36DRAFT_315812 [Microdochium trichocladiopsis]KAH7038220.1 hypothetical protein B0I36DRAFT_315812 [Microdochium trichocladiopsis]
MADDFSASGASPTVRMSGRDSFPEPSLRRAATVNFGSQPHPPHAQSGATGFGGMKRRGSGFSDSFGEARRDLENSADELFNPTRARRQENADRTALSYTPLALALLPALAGMFFQNGAAFFTDLILLAIAAVVLNWSVTQPWDWYFAAQQVRIANDEPLNEPVFESDSDLEMSTAASAATALENVEEESDVPLDATHDTAQKNSTNLDTAGSGRRSRGDILRAARRDAASKELFVHEMAALVWCFLFPLISTYMLHTIRNQLTRPSEGLVSDYNLTIFLCAAEFRPVKHMLKMVHDRTLRVQRVVAQSQYEPEQTISAQQVQELFDRIDDLESHAAAIASQPPTQSKPNGSTLNGEPSTQVTQAAVAREINKTMVPELEALNRAMRRYEKKLALLASQTDNRLEYIDFRLQDAIALAAVAAKNSKSNSGGLWSRVVEKAIAVALFPVHAAMAVVTFPIRTMSTMFARKRNLPTTTSGRRGRVNQGRMNSDRVPSRLSRR